MKECIMNWDYAYDSGCPYYENGNCWLDETEETRLCVIKDYEWEDEEDEEQ